MAALVLTPALITATASPASADPAEADGGLTVTVLPGAPGHLHDLAPGDRTEWAAQVTNTGDEPVPLYATFTTGDADPLTTDPDDGLQLSVHLCPRPLIPATLPGGPVVFTCPADTAALESGPAAELGTVRATSALQARASVGLRVRVQLPASAGNDVESTAANIRVHVTTTAPGSSAPGGGPAPTGPGDGPSATGAPTHGARPGAAHPNDTPGGHGPDGTGPDDTGPDDPAARMPDPAVAAQDSPGWGTSGPGLASTGRNLVALLVGALAAAAAGSALLVAARRRRRGEDTGA